MARGNLDDCMQSNVRNACTACTAVFPRYEASSELLSFVEDKPSAVIQHWEYAATPPFLRKFVRRVPDAPAM